jgi:DNA repair protein RadA/Sms
MLKTKTKYVCQSCGSDSPKWLGRCPACNEWNSFVEEVVVKETIKGVENQLPMCSLLTLNE